MYRQERYEKILAILQERKNVTVNYLAKTLHKSPSTVRRDLQTLAGQGIITHYYGGAAYRGDPSKAPPLDFRHMENHIAKTQIGRKAISLVNDGDILYLDSSSTCLCMVDALQNVRNITVVTNSHRVLESLSEKDILTYSTGGKLLRNSMAFTGPVTISCLENMEFDKIFFSCQAVTQDGYLTDGGEEENQIHRILLQKHGKKILLVDSSKLNKYCMFCIGQVEQLDYVVCDVDFFRFIKKPSTNEPTLLF